MPEPFRLLVDGHTFDVGAQGTTTFLAGVLNVLPPIFEQGTGRELAIYCATREASSAQRFLSVPHVNLEMPGGFARRNLTELPRLSRAIKADLTLSQYVRPLLPLHGGTACVIHDVLFLDFPELFPWSYRVSRQVLFGWSARHSDVVMTVSDYSRRRIERWFNVPAERIAVVPNGVEAPSLTDNRGETGRPRLLCVSRFEERKRQDWCIRGVADLAAAGVKAELDLVGSGTGPYAEKLHRMASESRGAVRIHTRLNDVELAQLMAQADLVLFPSAGEGFGIPVIEGAAAGIPCVVADNTALAELRPYFAGATFAGDHYDAFLAAVRQVLEDLPAFTEQAHSLAASVAAAFSWKAAAERFVAGLREAGCA